MTYIRSLRRIGLHRCLHPQYTVWASVLQVYCCIACLSPQMQWWALVMQHRLSFSHNRSVLPLSHPILLCVMGCHQFPFNTFCSAEVFKLLGYILPTIVATQGFYFLSRFFLCQGFKLTKPQEGLILILHKVDLACTRKIISKNKIVPLFSDGGCRERSTNI